MRLPQPPVCTPRKHATSIYLRAGFAVPAPLAPRAELPPPVIPECNANCAGSLPLLPTISLNTATASVRVSDFQPRDVSLVVNGAPPGSCGCTARSSSSASNAPTGPPAGSPAFATRVRVIVHPALFCSVFGATNHTRTEFVIDLLSNATGVSPRKKVRQLRVSQHSG